MDPGRGARGHPGDMADRRSDSADTRLALGRAGTLRRAAPARVAEVREQNPLDVTGSSAERPLIRTLGAMYGSRRHKGGPEMVERIALSLKPDFAPAWAWEPHWEELRCYQFWGPFGHVPRTANEDQVVHSTAACQTSGLAC